MAKRIKIPFLIDIVIVSNAEEIKQVEASEDIGRISSFKSEDLPWWVKFYFKATKFYDFERNEWFCPFVPKSDPSYQARIEYLEKKVAKGYSKEDVTHISNLLEKEVDDKALTYAMVQVVNKRFFEADIPSSVVNEAQYTLQSIGESINPIKYKRGCKAQKKLMNYCKDNLEDNINLVDVGHNIGEVVQATAGALKTLKENLDMDVEKIFTKHPLTPQVPRISIRPSKINGLLNRNAKVAQTVFICKIGKAAQETGDLRFSFGTGTSERECIFKNFFISFMKEIQNNLRNRKIVPA